MMRHISLWSVLAFAFVLAMPVQAEENTSAVLASVGVENITVHQEFDDVTISFDVVNYGDSVESDIHYVIDLYNTGENKNDQLDDHLVYHQNFDDIFSLPPGQKIHKEIKFIVPEYLGGEHQVWVRIVNSSSLRLSQMIAKQPLIFAIEGPSISMDENTCKVFIKGEEENYGLADGVDVAPEDKLRVACKVNSTHFDPMNVIPHFTTYYRSLYGDIIEERDNASDITIVPGNEEVIFEIPLTAVPQAYDVGIQLRDFDDQHLSNAVYAHYVLQGKSATIQNVKFNQVAYDKGDTATVELLWTPSADQFSSDLRRGEGSPLSEETKVLLTLTSDGKECAVATEETLTSNSGTFTIAVTKDCPHPSLALEIMDGDQALASGTFESGGKDTGEATPVGESEEKRSTGIILLWVFGITALIIIIILIVRGKNGPKRGVKALTFAIVASGMLFAGGVEADTNSEIDDLCGRLTEKEPNRWPLPPSWRSDGSWQWTPTSQMRYMNLCSKFTIEGNNFHYVDTGDSCFGDCGVGEQLYREEFLLDFDGPDRSTGEMCFGEDLTITYLAQDFYCTNGAGAGGFHMGDTKGNLPGSLDAEWLVRYTWGLLTDKDKSPYQGVKIIKDLPVGTHDIMFLAYGYWHPNVTEIPIVKTVKVVDCNPAACGTADSTNRSTEPSTAKEKCSVGTTSKISDTTTGWSWTCTETHGTATSTASCSANKFVNGACGTKHEKFRDSARKWWSSPGNELVGGTACETGTWTNKKADGSDITQEDGKVNWRCEGNALGSDKFCYGKRIECPKPENTLSIDPKQVLDVTKGGSLTGVWDDDGADSCTGSLETAEGNTTTNSNWPFPINNASPQTWTIPTSVTEMTYKYTYTCTNPNNIAGFDDCSTSNRKTITKCGSGQIIEGGVCKNVGKCGPAGTADTNAFFQGNMPTAVEKLCGPDNTASSVITRTPFLSKEANWTWQCQHSSGNSTTASCSANLKPECGIIDGINDPNKYDPTYTKDNLPGDQLCASGEIPMNITNDSAGKLSWTCHGADETKVTPSSRDCFVRYACPNDKLQCDKGNQCLDIDALNGTAMLTKDGVSGSQTMSVNIVNGDDPTPIVCSTNNNIECTVDIEDSSFTVDDFTISGGQSGGTYNIDGGKLSNYVKTPNDATSLEIDSVECETLANNGMSKDSAELIFTCLEAKCVGEGENATCKKTPSTGVSSVDDCVRECTSIGECTSSTGTIKEVQP